MNKAGHASPLAEFRQLLNPRNNLPTGVHAVPWYNEPWDNG
ncbi:hypothetical protein CDS [Bradyrhizobium sp.]|nr:hypothetical protein CDS [Bradyrhizobium sp.]